MFHKSRSFLNIIDNTTNNFKNTKITLNENDIYRSTTDLRYRMRNIDKSLSTERIEAKKTPKKSIKLKKNKIL